jgi:hypothetical protein
MSIARAPVGRIRDIGAKIKALEDILMSNRTIPMAEQAKIHADIRQLKKELQDLEKRTR